MTTTDRIGPGLVVSLAYTLTVDGEEIETATPDEPLDYLHGANNIVPGLERELVGKRVGERFTVTLPPEDAYGDYDEEDIEEIAREDIPDADMIEPGMVIVLEDDDGNIFDAVVKDVTTNTVILDFNPPLAGKAVTYDVEVIAMRPADEEELEHGHPHGMEYDDEDYDDDEE
ncbi:MAG: peptidylprolyl isomerase [bacterium]|nr:peptidylprolyl isomerase [bacterium]